MAEVIHGEPQSESVNFSAVKWGCAGKQTHASHAAAMKQIKNQERRRAVRAKGPRNGIFHAYLCWNCRHWHVGTGISR